MTAIRLHDNRRNEEWDRWNAQTAASYQPRHVAADERERYAQRATLRSFYDDCEAGRWESLDRRRGRKPGTKSKERQALNRWERYTLPPRWAVGANWPGPSLATLQSVSSEFFNEVWDRMLVDLANATVKSTRSHLQVLFRHAERVKAVEKISDSMPVERGDESTRIYTQDEVALILRALEPHADLRTAFRLSIDVGIRPRDLFSLRWTQLIQDSRSRHLLDFESRKTSKLQSVPLTIPAREALLDWQINSASSEWIFPGLSSPLARDPEKSYPARMRNSLMKRLMASVGIDVPNKPWQVGRSTCNERFESHAPGVGEFILGHAVNGVNAKSYREPSEVVYRAAATLPEYLGEMQLRLF